MKNNSIKRVLSIFLSVIMVVTMLPTFALTASAEQTIYGNGVMSEYLTDSNKNGFTGTATWDSTMNAWSFNGSQYLKLNDTPLMNVTTSSGFAISFEVYNTDNSLANKYFSFNNGSSRISMDGSSPDWWTRYRTEISDGSSTRGYYTSDFTSGDYCSTIASANGNDSYPINAWYTMTVVMNTDGSYSYYRNGDLLATFKSNYVSTGNGGGLSDANAAAAVAGATNYVIGASNTSGGEGFTGYIRNFKIISNVTSNSAGSLALLIERYEAKMASGTIYKNLAPAYEAYVDANEAFDAVVYGNSSTAQVSTAYSALNTALGNMTAWSAYTGTQNMYLGTIATGGYKNILYAPTSEGTSAMVFSDGYVEIGDKSWGTNRKTYYKGFAPTNVVLYYNGSLSDLYFPVGFEAYAVNDKNRTINYVDFNGDSNVELTRYWHGYQQGWNSTYGVNYLNAENNTDGSSDKNDGDHCSVGYSSSNTKSHKLSKDGDSKKRYWVNIAHIKALSSNSLSKSGLTFRMNTDYGTGTNSVATNIYVVNYYQLTQAVNGSKKEYFSKVADYKEGGLSTLMAKYDQATGYNIESTDYNTTASTYYTNAQNHCTTYASELNNVGTPTADTSANYVALRNAIDYKGNPTTLHNGDSAIKNNVYSIRELIASNGYVNVSGVQKQLTGFDTLLTRYNEATAIMSALGTTGYNTNSSSNYSQGSAAATAATNLISAFNALSLIELVAPTVTGETYLGPTDAISVTDTNNGNATYTWEYSTDNGSSWNNGGSVASAGGTFVPFSNATLKTAGTVKIRVKASISGADVYDNANGVSHTYFTAPTVKIGGNNVTDNQIVTPNTTVDFATTMSGASGTLKYSLDGGSWQTGNSVNVFTGDTTSATIQVKEIAGNSTSELTSTYTLRRKPNAPTVTSDGTYIDKTHGVSASLNDGNQDVSSVLEYSTNNGESWNTYSSKLLPFSGAGDGDTTSAVTYTFRAKRVTGTVTAYSETVSTTVNYLARPTLTFGGNAINDGDEFTDANRISVDSRINNNGTRKYYISDDNGSTWKEFEYSTSFAPFSMSGSGYDYTDDVTLKVKAVEESGTSVSAETPTYTILLKKLAPLTLYYKPDASTEKDTTYYRPNGAIYINTEGYSGKTVYYQTNIDGNGWGTLAPYNINAGIDSDAFTSAMVVQFRFFVVNNSGKTVFASGALLNPDNYNEVAFHESFDDASVSGSTLTFGDDSTATLRGGAGTASIVDGAGYVDGNNNSPDWRNNVLKINANSTAPGNSILLNTNPLGGKNAPAAKVNGVTISFWRYLERNGSCADLDASGDPTGYNWRNAIAFDDGDSSNGQGYYLIEVNGTNSVCTTQGTDYCDYVQENQDPTGHAAGNNRGHWVNVVITLDPNSGIMLYTNGEPHNMKASYPKKSGTFAETDAEVAQDIIELITSDSTNMYFNYGDKWEGNDYDMYLDDIRIYTGVKSQVDINNMYIGNDTDVQSDFSSTSHDPTNVTVYTLARDLTYTISYENGQRSRTINLSAGAQVGQELVDKEHLNTTIGAGDISAIDEYSFGTGMTVYHLNKTTKKWEVVGDDQGRCGYQNQKLFGAEYHTALAEPLAYAATDSRTGAGHLVWAPHVMFNIFTGKWMYYGSTSSWGSATSAIFLCKAEANGSIEGPYTYDSIIYKSSGNPNAIDACVYYGYTNTSSAGYGAVYEPNVDQLYMAFGSWGGETCIKYKALSNDGTTSNNTSYDGTLCHGINSTLEGASDGGSGEGAYVVFENGNYYLYVSYGQNTGSYVERVFRSTSPTGGFVGCNGVSATDTTTTATHGGQILAPFDLSCNDYLLVSTGHNSVYKTYNSRGELVTLNSAHARPYANEGHYWKALPDGALATRQSEVTGNVNMVNQIAYVDINCQTGNAPSYWPVIMPFQYNGTDTVKPTITAADLRGVYGANDLQNTEYFNYAPEYTYTIIEDETDPTGMTAFEYGTDDNGVVFKDYIKISYGADGTCYATYYTDKNNMAGTVLYQAVVGKQGDKISLSMICTRDYEYTWTYRIADIPQTEDVTSLGDSVSMDGVIYTHLSGQSYAKYGYEISDDFQYGTSDLHQGERCTTITTTYPAKVDVANPTAIYCLSDEKFCKSGQYSGGDFTPVALNNNKWFDEAGHQYSDADAISRNGIGEDGTKLKRRYGVTGFVSDYYFDSSTGTFQNKGVSLIISYYDVENTSNKYSEFEFCYVMANPAMAHTIQGIRNQYGSGQVDMHAGYILFDRFIGSYGSTTNIGTSQVWNHSCSATSEEHGFGTYKYLDSFGSDASKNHDYSAPDKTKTSFDFFDSKIGVNSGSYGLIEHNNGDEKSYTVSSNVVDTDYYVDYSNKDNYDVNNSYGIIETEVKNGKTVPKGYKFRFRTSNIQWNSKTNLRWGTTSYMYLGGQLKTNATVNSTYNSSIDTYSSTSGDEYRNTYGNMTSSEMSSAGITDKNFQISGIGSASTNNSSKDAKNYNGLENKYSLGLSTEQGRKVMSGYYANTSAYDTAYPNNDYYTMGLQRALPLVDSGNTSTNTWNMHIDFTGTQSVAKNADPGSGDYRAEKYANFIIEQGVNVFSWNTVVFATNRWVNSEETYAYYNIGVHTCDKGAARTFAKNYLRKRLAYTENEDGTITVKRNANGAPIYLTPNKTETTDVTQADLIDSQEFTLASYQQYIDAVAKLKWFVENPTNTTFGDYVLDEDEAKPYNTGEEGTEYVTAYDASGNPIYNTTTGGDNIFDKNVSNVKTDKVQAKLIEDVITAYQNLFDQDDYDKAEVIYGKIDLLEDGVEPSGTIDVEDIDQIKITPAEGESGSVVTYDKADFTEDSWEDFVQLVVDVSPAFNYKSGDVNPRDPDSWRHVVLSGAEYRNLIKILKRVESTLLPEVDIDDLSSAYTTKYGNDLAGSATGTVTGGIFTSTAKTVSGTDFAAGDQVYSFSSWESLNNKCTTAKGLINPSATATYAKNQTITVDGDDIVNKGDNEEDFTYTEGLYDVTGITKYTFDNVDFYARDVDTTTYSDIQQTVNSEYTALSALNLTVVDSPSCYTTYDNAKTVLDSLDMDKYTDEGQSIITAASTDTYANVYTVLTETQANAYNSILGSSLVREGQILKSTTTGATDPQSAALMTAINTVNSTKVGGSGTDKDDYRYIKYFKVLFNIQKVDAAQSDEPVYSDEQKVMYGDPITLSIGENNSIVNWGVSIYDGTYATEFSEKPRASQKITSINGGTLTRIVNNNMAIVAEIEEEAVPANKIQYNILDCYGNMYDVIYGTSLTRNGAAITASTTINDTDYPLLIDGKEISPKLIPFYSLSGWTVTRKSDTLFTVRPTYDVAERFTMAVIDNGTTTTENVQYDKKFNITVSDTNDAKFAAWAVKTSNNKYQIASYSKSYTFYACEAETYVVIINDGTDEAPVYKTVDGVTLNASNIDSEITETGSISTDEFITSKLKNKDPFVSVQRAQMTNLVDGKYRKARVYVRITQGCDSEHEPTSYGILYHQGTGSSVDEQMFINGTGTYRRAVTNKLESGQFTYTLSSKNGFNSDVTFRGYVNYDFTYSAGGTSATINGLDYSRIATATRS